MRGPDLVSFSGSIPQPGPVQVTQPPCRSSRVKGNSAPVIVPTDPSRRKHVHDRWFDEPAEISPALLSVSVVSSTTQPSRVSFGSTFASSSVVSSQSSGDGPSGSSSGLPPASPRAYAPLRCSGHKGKRFNVRLSYPDGEQPPHLYSVFHGMPVPGLRYTISYLFRVDSPVVLWEALDHRGAITDRVLPGAMQSCPFLVPGSNVRVYCTLSHQQTALSMSSSALSPSHGFSLVPSRLSDCDSVSDLISTVPAFSLVPSRTTSHNSGLPATFSGSIESVSSIDVPDSPVVSS